MSTKVASFISRLVVHFPVRFETEERELEWIQSLSQALRSYDASVLERAAQRIVETRTERRFPLVGEINKVLQSIAYDDQLQQKMLGAKDATFQPEKVSKWSDSRQQWADSLVMGELGRQAAKEGWILALHNHVVETGKLPERGEIHALQRSVNGFDEALDKCRAGGFPLAGVLVELGISMLQRREQLTEMVLHGVARR